LSIAQDLFCCPDCRSGMVQKGALLTCTECGRTARVLAPDLVKFLPGDEMPALNILNWPPQFLERLPSWLDSDGSVRKVSHDFAEQLAGYGLIRTDGAATSLGEIVQYNRREFMWQARRKSLDGLLELGTIGPKVRVLDVGCGAAQ